MNQIPGFLLVSILGGLLFTFPGLLFARAIHGLNTLSRLVVTLFMSLGLWICIAWFISWAGLPLAASAYSLLLLFIVCFFFKYASQVQAHLLKLRQLQWRRIPLHHAVLAATLLLLCTPLVFLTIPPGCDTAMHGYITRLIINQNGLPHSYRPILPVDYFGSYSAGYHVITALISGINPLFLRHAINFVSVMVYPLTLLSFVFFLMPFFSQRTAIYAGIIFFGINHTLIGTMGWGGNPSILAFAFCLFSFGLVLFAVRNKSAMAFCYAALPVAAIPLVHAIPAITFVYLSFIGYAILLYHYRNILKWILLQTAVLGFFVLLLLAPFLIHFRNENAPELLTMIRNWQNEMMGGKLTNNLPTNLAVAAEQIKYRICDVLTILTGFSLVVLFYFKRYRQISYIGIFIVSVYVLVFNSAYWFLPLSELLYPERVVYFMIVCWCFIFGFAITEFETGMDTFALFKGKVTLYSVIVFVLLAVSAGSIVNEYTGMLPDNQINCNSDTRAAFHWIDHNTEKDALFDVTYGNSGMWVPAFTNRAASGGHIHFIHIVQHIPDTLAASTAPRYIFVTKKDMATNTKIMEQIPARHKVFANSEVAIYH